MGISINQCRRKHFKSVSACGGDLKGGSGGSQPRKMLALRINFPTLLALLGGYSTVVAK